MRYAEIMTEAIIDYRVPEKTYQASWDNLPHAFTTCFVLGKRSTLIYNMPIGNQRANEREWEIEAAIKKLVPNEWHGWTTSMYHPTFELKDGRLIMKAPRTIGRKGGEVNRYSDEVIHAAQAFLKRGLVPPNTPMLLLTVSFAHPIGTVADVAQHTEQHDLILYHGTTSGRAAEILRDGLRPNAGDLAHRQWREKTSPDWRETAVYLTASPDQAAIYATRAVTNARKRHEKGQKPAVLKVRIDPSLFGQIRPDDDYLRAMGTEGRDWRHSLGFYGQVAVVGTIPANHIELTGIHVKNRRASSATAA